MPQIIKNKKDKKKSCFEDKKLIKNIDNWIINKTQKKIVDPNNIKKAIVLFSGGLDSTVLIYFLVKVLNIEIYPCYVADQPRSKKEIKRAKDILRELRKTNSHLVNKLYVFKNFSVGSWAYKNKELDKNNRELVNMIIDFRHQYAFMYSQILKQTKNIDIKTIICGITKDDSIYNPAQTLTAIRLQQQKLMFLSSNKNWIFFSPFAEEGFKQLSTKKDLITLGNKLGVPLFKTWSCFKSGPFHCGKCGNCYIRKQSFIQAHVKDTTIYINQLQFFINPKNYLINIKKVMMKILNIRKNVLHLFRF